MFLKKKSGSIFCTFIEKHITTLFLFEKCFLAIVYIIVLTLGTKQGACCYAVLWFNSHVIMLRSTYAQIREFHVLTVYSLAVLLTLVLIRRVNFIDVVSVYKMCLQYFFLIYNYQSLKLFGEIVLHRDLTFFRNYKRSVTD